jgi:aspartokinase/homoserine dehydrogenase 1
VVHADGIDQVVADLKKVAKVEVEEGNALVAVIGERMREESGLASAVFDAVGAANVPLRCISYGATKTNLQMVVPQHLMAAAVRALHRVLFPETKAA